MFSAMSCSPKVMKIFVPGDAECRRPEVTAFVVQRADVGAGLRLGEVHRAGPLARDEARR